MNYITQPQQIEQESFVIIGEIIAAERPDYRFASELHEKIIKRAIHTTADFDWLDILHFSDDALASIEATLRAGATLYTDTTMALSGINKSRLAELGCQIHCFIAQPEVAEMARSRGVTRSMAAVDLAMSQPGPKLFVFGNAPTALFRLLELCQEDPARSCPVIGVPVGFVGAAESKQALAESALPHIAALGRKGGSNVAAAIINAVLYHQPKAAS